jgi:peptidoglycan/LPS O-acetylase OafA/YrhL
MKNKIPSLDGLRALSILFVLIGHVQVANLKLHDAPGAQIGVNIFFVISGFLITLLLLKEETKSGTISLKGFYIRRVIRIFPVYYFTLLVYFGLQLLNVFYLTPTSWITSITYTKYFNFNNDPGDWETGHFWSLSVEEHFYLIWPVVFYFLKKYRTHFAIAIIVIVPFVRLFTDISVMHLFTRADSLMWGCLFAIYYEPIVAFVKKRNNLLLISPFVLLAACLVIKRIVTIVFSNVPYLEESIIAFAGSFGTITNICIGFIIVVSINYTNNIWFRFLNTKIMSYTGVLSYSIYIWQQLFFSENMGSLSKFPYNLIYIFITAYLSYNLIELPFLKLKDKLQGREKTKPSGNTVSQ